MSASPSEELQEGFYQWCFDNDIEITAQQMLYADILLLRPGRNVILFGGRKSGRTFITNLVDKFFKENPSYAEVHSHNSP